jgi:hypothetical protein|tara:strand:- start:124 stop:732 length:609 start_codon:yes stop_codon:yes gene_type:complete
MSFVEAKDGEVDYLDVDTQIPGQQYVCISFISPEKVLIQKDQFIMKKFIKSLTDESGNIVISADEFDTKYTDYISLNSEEIEQEFHKESGFQTTMRGVKIRGTYNTYDEATQRAKILQSSDRDFHVFVGQVGYWLPWDPNADNIADQQYMEKELNELMSNYKSNQLQRDMFYQNQVDEQRKKANEETEKKKQKIKEEEAAQE